MPMPPSIYGRGDLIETGGVFFREGKRVAKREAQPCDSHENAETIVAKSDDPIASQFDGEWRHFCLTCGHPVSRP